MGKGIYLFFVALVGVGLLFPGKSVDVAKLIPMEVLVVTMEGNSVVVTDGNLQGVGTSWEGALENLQEKTPGEAFLGTVGHVIVMDELLEDVVWEPQLRPAAKLYRWVEPLDYEQLVPFLKAHPGEVTIASTRRERQGSLPMMRMENGGVIFA